MEVADKVMRRASGPARIVPDVDEELEEEIFAGITSEDESGSDWEASKKSSRRKSEKPLAKKTKVASASGGATVTIRGKKGRLSCLPTMPLDILFEIFRLLHPADLLSLARAGKALRQVLMTRKATGLWKAAMSGLDPAPPPCPPDLSEPAWANLLFGAPRCEECATPNVHKVLFGLRRRLCTSCLKDSLIFSRKFSKVFPEYDDEIMDLIPYTHFGGWAQGHRSQGKFFWTDDIHDMGRTLASYQRDVKMGKSGAQKVLGDFKIARKQAVKDILSYAPTCEQWMREATSQRTIDMSHKRNSRRVAVLAKCIGLGYAERDLACLANVSAANVPTPLTEQIWKRIRPKVESEVQESIDRRLARERESVIQSRKADVKAYYRRYRLLTYSSKPVKECFLLPRDWDLFQIEGVARVIDREGDKKLDDLDGDVVELKASMHMLVQNWMDARTLDMAGKLPTAVASTSNAEGHEAAIMARRQLTMSVFRCSTPSCMEGDQKVLIGWEDAIAHQCRILTRDWTYSITHAKSCVEYDVRGSAAVAYVAQSLNLDLRSTVPSAMDQLDARMACMTCPASAKGRRYAMPWREAVRHYAFAEDHPLPQFEVFTEPVTANVRKRESPDPVFKRSAWSCNLCPAHIDSTVTRDQVLAHVSTSHARKAVEDEDYFLDPKERHSVKRQLVYTNEDKTFLMLSVQDGDFFHCLHCTNDRKFRILGVRDHLRMKHKVIDSKEGTDFIQVSSSAPPILSPPLPIHPSLPVRPKLLAPPNMRD